MEGHSKISVSRPKSFLLELQFQVILAAGGKRAFAFRKCLPQKLQLEEEDRVHCVSLYLCTTSTTESAAPVGP